MVNLCRSVKFTADKYQQNYSCKRVSTSIAKRSMLLADTICCILPIFRELYLKIKNVLMRKQVEAKISILTGSFYNCSKNCFATVYLLHGSSICATLLR